MSSILKALKKLESEKSQRDELSTAVASEILRSSRVQRRSSVPAILATVLFALAIGAAGYFIALDRSGEHREPTDRSPAELAEPSPVPKDRSVSSPPPASPLPRLSGIVYQQDPGSRLAIINDLPVMVGTLVEGYDVRVIYPDRVVVSKGGAEFTLFLEKVEP